MWNIYIVNQQSEWELWADGFPVEHDAWFFLWCRGLVDSENYCVSDRFPLTLPQQLQLSLDAIA